MGDESSTGLPKLPPRFTAAKLEALSLLAYQFALHYTPAATGDQSKMFEISNALLEASKTVALLEQLSSVLGQVAGFSSRPGHVKNDRYLADRIPGTESPGWCAECGGPQFITPSGNTCVNGHGGAETLPNRPQRWP